MAVNFCNYIHCPARSSWGPRQLNDCELIYFVSGQCLWQPEGEPPVRILPHRILLIPPALRHTLSCEVPSVISCIHCDGDAGQWRLYLPEKNETPRLYQIFRDCAAEFEGTAEERSELLELLVAELQLRLRRIGPGAVRRPALLDAMTGYIDSHLTAELTRRTLAARFKVTPEHVNYLFRTFAGIAPSHYINRQRVYRAYELLLTEAVSVKETAGRVGFADEYYFGRVFKAVTGVSPGRIRR